VRDATDQALTARGAAMGAGHVGLGPALVDEHHASGVDPLLETRPAPTLGGDVRPRLFGGPQAFLKVSLSAARNDQTAP
jgi:hypothetical protein